MAAAKKEQHPRVHTMVRYYRNGWRFGTLEAVDGKTASIRPIAHNKTPRAVQVPIEDVDFDEANLK